MAYYKKLGVFEIEPGGDPAKNRFVPPLTETEARVLHGALLRDLFARISKLKKLSGTVFYSGGDPERLQDAIPKGYSLQRQTGGGRGERLISAFDSLLQEEGNFAVVIMTESPDIPLNSIKRAYLRLKHKDVVLGPSSNGSYYLIGLKRPIPELFENIRWDRGATILRETLDRIESHGLSLTLLPLWYSIDTARSLAHLDTMMLAKRIEKSGRLHHAESVLSELRGKLEEL